MTILVLGVVFTLIGGYTLYAAVGVARQERRFASAVRTSGQIVDVVVERRQTGPGTAGSSTTRTYSYPVLRFKLPDGREVTQRSQYGDMGRRGVGDSLEVEYDREDPTLVRAAGSSVGRLGAVIAAGVGTVFLVLGIAFLVSRLG